MRMSKDVPEQSTQNFLTLGAEEAAGHLVLGPVSMTGAFFA